MIWILVTILVSLVVILAQLLLAYQKRAVRLRLAQNPVRRQIDNYKEKLTETADEVRSSAAASLKQLRRDIDDYQLRSGQAANLTAELDGEAQAWVEARDEEAGREDAAVHEEDADPDDQASDGDGLIGSRHDPSHKVDTGRTNPLDLVRAIRHDLEEIYQYIENLRTDALIVQQTLERLGPRDKDRVNGSD